MLSGEGPGDFVGKRDETEGRDVNKYSQRQENQKVDSNLQYVIKENTAQCRTYGKTYVSQRKMGPKRWPL